MSIKIKSISLWVTHSLTLGVNDELLACNDNSVDQLKYNLSIKRFTTVKFF